ncbi:MAG TPA: ribosome biogenesis factor YjgA [Deltaproteobacteria bacterium]|nr:ribosome biogenesis factor YjgA [Deltaproteobacteria bacterium]
MRDDHGPDDESRQPEELKKSKTMRKKEMLARLKLGERVLDLPASYLNTSGIPSELLEAVLAAKKISTFGARKRQRQYIGAIMREVDPDLIRRTLDEFGQTAMK